MNNIKYLIPILLLGLLILIGAGCGKKETGTVPQSGEQTSEAGEKKAETSDTFAGLSTLSFKQDFGEGTYKVITTYSLRNLDKERPDIRTERYMPNSAETRTITIVLGQERKGWVYAETSFGGGEWKTLEENTDISFEDEIDELSHIEYEVGPAIKNGKVIKQEHHPGPTLRIYDIELNPDLDPSLFKPDQ